MFGRASIFFCAVSFLILVSGCANNSHAPTRKTTEGISGELQLAKQFSQSRQHKNSIRILQRYLTHHPDHPDAIFMIGRAYFAMAEYAKAAVYFRKALVITPQHIDARHRLWAATLQNNYTDTKIKTSVRSEIERYLASNPVNPHVLLTAYYGYRYLWDHKQQQQLIALLAENANTALLRRRVADALQYEILTSKTKITRTQLSERYLSDYVDLADGTIAASWLFSNRVIKKDMQLLEGYIAKYTGNTPAHRTANLYAAQALIRSRHAFPVAISLLQLNVKNIKKNNSGGKFNSLLAQNTRQLGIAYFKINKYRRARQNLLSARALQTENGTASYYLGKIADAQNNSHLAITYYRESLAIDGRQAGAKNGLSRLVKFNKESASRSQSSSGKNNSVVFADVTNSVGLENVRSHRVAWGDYDNDGDDDLLVNGTRIFNNNNGFFVDVTAQVKLPNIANATGGIWGDYNNDGFLDVFVTVNGTNRLLQNIDGKMFLDVSQTILPKGSSNWSEAAAWGDFNQDGYLDLYIANYQSPAVERGICSHDTLLINMRGKGFVAADESILPRPDEAMCGRGVTWVDFNGDRHQDIFVSNYRLDPNILWLNRDRQFSNNAIKKNVAGKNVGGYFGNSIGAVFSDFDNNGRIDLFVANLSHPRDEGFSDRSQLYMQKISRKFNLMKSSGIGFEETLSDPATADVDNDGDVDLFISAIYPSGQSHLYINDGLGRFSDISWLSQTRLRNTWGAAFSDYDNDGDMDLVVASESGVRLLKNNSAGRSWIKISVQSRRCNFFGIGARIEIRYRDQTQSRVITAGRGTGNQDSLVQHFGLGNYQGPVEISLVDVCGNSASRMLSAINQKYLINY